eukprot:GCRY01002196.1.p1 GENE.GCRY01002196.1~~GCRY01002196.1.p1  ORF type:complete len:348 (+),score=83.51 GCRY01002196.1:156-1199(+)
MAFKVEVVPSKEIVLSQAETNHEAHISLFNNSNSICSFKVKTTKPKRYSVKPTSGLLEPNSNVTILVNVVEPNFDETAEIKDKFLIALEASEIVREDVKLKVVVDNSSVDVTTKIYLAIEEPVQAEPVEDVGVSHEIESRKESEQSTKTNLEQSTSNSTNTSTSPAPPLSSSPSSDPVPSSSHPLSATSPPPPQPEQKQKYDQEQEESQETTKPPSEPHHYDHTDILSQDVSSSPDINDSLHKIHQQYEQLSVALASLSASQSVSASDISSLKVLIVDLSRRQKEEAKKQEEREVRLLKSVEMTIAQRSQGRAPYPTDEGPAPPSSLSFVHAALGIILALLLYLLMK